MLVAVDILAKIISFGPILPFFDFMGRLTAYPYIALLIGIAIFFVYFKLRKNIYLATSVLWILYGIYEYLNLLKITCSGECDIRIDLILIYPILLILTLISIILLFKKIVA